LNDVCETEPKVFITVPMEKLTKFNTLNHDYTSFPPKLWELDILDFAAPNIIQANDTLSKIVTFSIFVCKIYFAKVT